MISTSVLDCFSCVFTAGVFCAIVSHPADSVVSVLNKEKGSTAVQVLKRLGPKGAYPWRPASPNLHAP